MVCTGVTGPLHGAPSDHSACFIDLHPDIFAKNCDPTSPTLRSVTSKQRSKFFKYGKHVNGELQSCSCTAYLINLLDTASDPSLLQDIVNAIDSQIGRLKKNADHFFQRTPSFQAWSPVHRNEKILYHEALRHIRQFTSHNRPLLPIPSHIDSNRPAILKFLRAHLKSVEKELKLAEKHCFFNRFTFLSDKLQQAYNDNNPTKIKRFKNILQSEIKQEAFRLLTPNIEGSCPGSLDRILVSQDDTTIEVTDSEELFQILLNRNKTHFAQSGTDKTPFTCPPFSNILPPFSSNSNVTNNALQGDLSDFPPLPEHIKCFSKAFSAPSGTTFVNDDYSLTDFKSDMKRTPEKKSSSSSGRSCSFYKAISNFTCASSTMVKLINTCKNIKTLLTRWLTILQTMICERPGNFNVDSLQVIQLPEVDLDLHL